VASSSSSLSSAPSSLAWVAAAVARPAMTGLLAADPSLRHDFLSALFGPSNQPRLVSMLKHDWDALASRYVVVPLVDVLLGGLQQQHCPLTLVAPGPTPNPTPVSTLWAPPRMRPASSTLGGTSEASQALAGTRRSEARQRVAQAHHEVMARLHNMRQAGLGTALLGPLRHLLHAHPLLAKDLLGPLLQSAWSGLSEAQQGQQGAALVALLCKGTPRQALALPTYLQPSAAGLQHSINSIQALLQVHKLTTPCLPHETHKTHAFLIIIDNSYICPRQDSDLDLVLCLVCVPQSLLSLRPFPVLPADVLGALAANYNAWAAVLPTVEHQVQDTTTHLTSPCLCLSLSVSLSRALISPLSLCLCVMCAVWCRW
jgi:hypothetical protein